MAKKIETTGAVYKEEELATLNHDVMKNTFVIDISHPFPGYYGAMTHDENRPRAVILVTKVAYTWEKIIRATERINNYLDLKLNGSKVTIYLGNSEMHGIRIKGLPSYAKIPQVQNAFKEEGFQLMRKRNFSKGNATFFRLNKFFFIEKLDEGIYKDTVTDGMHYILIDKHLNWELFRNITRRVKNNVSDRNCDIIEGWFFMNGGIVDMIRIYKPDMTLDLLKELREKYMDNIEKFSR